MTHGRRYAAAVIFALVFVVAAGTTAHAASAYRYWAYYIAGDGSWQYSQRGPAAEHPDDGEVQGWRFAIQADRTGALAPRSTPDFATLCPSMPAEKGHLRVGVVLDFGIAGDAPAGDHRPATIVVRCVRVSAGASGADVLQAAVGAGHVRIIAGLICGIDGYPRTECAATVDAPKASTPAASPAAPVSTPTPPARHSEQASTPEPAMQPKTTMSSAPAAGAPTSASRAATSASTAGPASALTETAPTTVVGLRTASHHDFPIGAVVGGVLVAGLATAAIVRGLAGRR
jgi:hypothetical protein